MISHIQEYKEVVSRERHYKDAYKDLIIQVGKNKRLNEFEKFILQLIYHINIVFEEDIRVILNTISGYSLATTVKNLKKYGFIKNGIDDTYGKFFYYTQKTERLLNPCVNSPSNFKVSKEKIEKYRLISAITCVQLTKGLTNSSIETLILRFNKLPFAKFGLYSEIEKSKAFFRTVLINGKSHSILKLEEEYTYLIKTKTILASKRRACLTNVKNIIQDRNKIVITYKEQQDIKKLQQELQRIEEDINLIEKQMEYLRKYLGKCVKPYNSTKKDTVMTLRYFLQNGVIWYVQQKDSAYLFNVYLLDFTRYGKQNKLFELLYNLSIYLTDRLGTSNFKILLTVYRVDDKLNEYEKYCKYAIDKFKALKANGNAIAGIHTDTLYEVNGDKINYRIYNILIGYPPYKKVIPLRFAEKEYKRKYYEQKKMKDNN